MSKNELHPCFEKQGFSADTVEALGWLIDQLTPLAARRYGLPEATGTGVWFIPYRAADRVVLCERSRLMDDDVERFKGGKCGPPADERLAPCDPEHRAGCGWPSTATRSTSSRTSRRP